MRRFLALDLVVVILFVVLGRETHDEGNAVADILETAAPFLIALLAGWAATRIWLSPVGLLRGAVVGVITIAAGMLMRRLVFDDGTAAAFIVVATVFNLGGMLGWRWVVGRFAVGNRAAT